MLGWVTGCTPPGPRALLEGKQLLERGDYAAAVEKLRVATSLLATNAQAWNYLGLAYHQNGQGTEAERAYQRALAFNRDLTEAHFNLGCLWLEENKLEGAKSELLACTLRRGNSLEVLLKLGTAQLRSRELVAAERTFADALRLSPKNVEATTGIGMSRAQRGRATEAVQWFKAALQEDPHYGPALLNLAVVAQQQLRDRSLALQNYREYADLKPAPDNVAAVRGMIRQLELELSATSRPAPAPPATGSSNTNAHKPTATEVARTTNTTKATAANSAQSAAAARTDLAMAATKPVPAPTPTPAPANASTPAAPPMNRETVRLAPEPTLRTAQDQPENPATSSAAADQAEAVNAGGAGRSADGKTPKRGFLRRINPLNLFTGQEKNGVRTTPLPNAAGAAPAVSSGSVAASEFAGDVSNIPRYTYKVLAAPAEGDHASANRSFSQGFEAQAENRLPDAIQAYRRATQLDPAFFDAYYNLALVAKQAGKLSEAMTAYETALSLRPTALDARYHFALALKQSNYFIDAANELEKLLATYPNEIRGHLALGNLYAQQLRQPGKARLHYLKVLELDPGNSQGPAISYWLANNHR